MNTFNRAISRNIGAGGGLLPKKEKFLECTGWALKSSLTRPSERDSQCDCDFGLEYPRALLGICVD